jgi:hypothetical protein
MLENGPALWGACTVSLTIAAFFIKVWINRLGKDLEKMEIRMEDKLDRLLCTERMESTKSTCMNFTAQNNDDHKDIFSRLRILERGDKQ